MIVDAPPLTIFRRDTPAALQEVILVALRREMSERFQSAMEFADALSWSRAQAPAQPEVERGSWLTVGRSEPRQQAQATPSAAAPVGVATEGELDLSQQSTVLRVMIDPLPDDTAEPEPGP